MASENLQQLVKDIEVAQFVAKPTAPVARRMGPALGGFSSYIVV